MISSGSVRQARCAPRSRTERVQRENYTLGALGDAELNICAEDSPTGENLDYLWVFRYAAGGCVGDNPDPVGGGCPNSGLNCGTQIYNAPPKAVQLTILLDGPIFGPLDCLVSGPGDSLGIGTQGTVTATRQ